MSKPMTRKEWLSYLEQTWDAAQKKAWSEQPRREWVGLTDEEIKMLPQWYPSHETAAALPLIRAVEAKLKQRNT